MVFLERLYLSGWWRYTAFVRNRGVIENKGYFAGAELVPV